MIGDRGSEVGMCYIITAVDKRKLPMKTLTKEEMAKAINLMDDEARLSNAVKRSNSADDYDGESLVARADKSAEVRAKHLMNAAKTLKQQT